MNSDFDRDGFVILKQIISKSLLDNFHSGLAYLIRNACEAEGVTSTEPFHQAFIELDKKNHYQIHLIYNILRKSNLIAEIINDKKIVQAVKKFMGLSVEQSYYNTYHVCRMDPPNDSTYLLKWHQESYSTIPHTNSLQLWAPLVDRNSAENGSIDVLRGSHMLKEVPHFLERLSENYVSYSIKTSSIRNYEHCEKVTIDAEPGDVVLFSPYLIHKSNHNQSNKVRYSLTSHYVDPHDPNFELLDDNELIRKNRLRCENANDFYELIRQEKQVYY